MVSPRVNYDIQIGVDDNMLNTHPYVRCHLPGGLSISSFHNV